MTDTVTDRHYWSFLENRILVLIVIVLVGGFAYVRHLATRGIPEYDGKLQLSGLSAEVTVYRDQYAVPHIYAQNERDLYRAVGYCMAQDRLFQMDLIRRVTMGRLAEVVGEEAVKIDHLMRALRIAEKSRLMISKTDPAILSQAEAFCQGINQFVALHKDRLPVEFAILGYTPEKWEPVHVFNVASYMAFDLSTGWKIEVMFYKVLAKVGRERLEAILPDMPAYREVVYPDFGQQSASMETEEALLAAGQLLEQLGLTMFSGSNNWAVSGKKSVTGKPILANDMHLGLNAPGIWYQMHQVATDTGLNVTGVVVPGQPFVTAGHTPHIAWGFTNVMVDDMDFYLEKINPDNPDEYEFNGQWRKMTVKTEKIKVKGGEIVEKKIRFTHRGPIISEFKKVKKEALSMRWTGNEYSNESRTLYLLARARNWDDFKRAVSTFRAVSQNIIYADVNGNIGLYCSAGVPMRKKGAGLAVMPGWTAEYDWQGLVPFEELPHSYNPESGFLSSANNKTVPDEYPHYISSWFCPSYRYRRIHEMLTAKEKLSIEDFMQMHADWKSKLVEDMHPDIMQALEGAELTAVEKQAAALLSKWDGSMRTESTAAAVFEHFYVAFLHNVFRDELGEELLKEFLNAGDVTNFAVERIWADQASVWYDDVNSTDRQERFNDIVLKSFQAAVANLQQDLGGQPESWQWGKIHQLTLKHPLGGVKILDKVFGLNRGPYEIGGSSHTVSPYQYRYKKPFHPYHGASQRFIYSLADWNESLSVIPTGNCGVPASKYYCDQTEMYLANEYHPDYIRRDLVEKSAVHELTLTP